MKFNLKVVGAKKYYLHKYDCLRIIKDFQSKNTEVKIPVRLNLIETETISKLDVSLETDEVIGFIQTYSLMDVPKNNPAIIKSESDLYYLNEQISLAKDNNEEYLKNQTSYDFLNNILKNGMIPDYNAFVTGYETGSNGIYYILDIDFL